MIAKIVTASALLGATLLAAASPSGGADQNRTIAVRTVVHTHDAAFSDKPAPGPWGLVKAYAEPDESGPAVKAQVVYLPKAGAEK